MKKNLLIIAAGMLMTFAACNSKKSDDKKADDKMENADTRPVKPIDNKSGNPDSTHTDVPKTP